MPLAWAHAEYIKLVRSAADGQVFDLIPEVADRYRNRRRRRRWRSGSSTGRCVDTCRGNLADSGGFPVPIALDLRRMEASA